MKPYLKHFPREQRSFSLTTCICIVRVRQTTLKRQSLKLQDRQYFQVKAKPQLFIKSLIMQTNEIVTYKVFEKSKGGNW